MASLKDHFGSTCPVCARDILQSAPSVARMPPGEYAYCPTCESALALEDLERLVQPRTGFLARLLLRFRKPTRA